MSEQAADQVETTKAASQAPTWIGGAGLVLVAIGLFGAVSIWVEMSDVDFGGADYTTIDKWLGVLAALMVTGLGLVTLALAAVLSRLAD
jgi:hypothetical protein